jgi:hypothetical protein
MPCVLGSGRTYFSIFLDLNFHSSPTSVPLFISYMVHLVPNAVFTLALFAHTCEMFVGVQGDDGVGSELRLS